MGVNSLPKTVTRQRSGCDLNPGPSVPESSTLTTRLLSHSQTTQQHKTMLTECHLNTAQQDVLSFSLNQSMKEHSETVTVTNYQNADCSLRKKVTVSFLIIFGTLLFPIQTREQMPEFSSMMLTAPSSHLDINVYRFLDNCKYRHLCRTLTDTLSA